MIPLKLNLWLEIAPWNLGNDLQLRQDSGSSIYVSQVPFSTPCSPDIQRFKVTVEIPYVIESDVPLGTVKAVECPPEET